MQRPVASLPLSRGQRTKLRAAGFNNTEDIKEVSLAELSKELNISTSEALEILKVVNGNEVPTATHPAGGQSALELLRAEQEQPFIVSFSSKVDDMLGGGIAMGKITEICGAPGIGKTQLSMQLAVDVCIPELLGGAEGEAVYIDTEGSFIVERVVEIALAAVQHISSVADKSEDPELRQCAQEFTLDKILDGIHYFRCHDHVELVALVNILPQFRCQHPKVRLVVVDSVAAPFRLGFADMAVRNRVLSGMAQNLIKLATIHNLAVVLTNQMTTKPHPQNRTSSQLVPALGASWGHVSTIRVVLYWNQSQRLALLYKSPAKPETVVPFQITQDGVRDAVEAAEQLPLSQEASSEWLFLSSSQLDDLENSPDEQSSPHLQDTDLMEPGNAQGMNSRKRSRYPES